MHEFLKDAITCSPECDLVVFVEDQFQIEVGEFENDVIGARTEHDAGNLFEQIKIKRVGVNTGKK